MNMHSPRLIAVTKPVIPELETPGQLLAYCARVSSTANKLKHHTGPRLLRSLVRRKEWSPFEMVHLNMEILTTRDIGRQILRHGKAFGFQEFSQRYAAVDTDSFVFRDARDQHPTDRQLSIPTKDGGVIDWWNGAQREVAALAARVYGTALNVGIAREVARIVLPEGMTPTEVFMSGSLRAWIHYCQLRNGNGTQLEHEQIARQCWELVLEQFPELIGLGVVGEERHED